MLFEELKTDVVEVKLWNEEGDEYPATKEEAYIEINSYGGDVTGYQIPLTLHYTGAKVNKFERCKLETQPATEIECPILAQSPLTLECRVTDIIPLGTHDMFLADIVAVDVDESLLDKDGKLHLDRAGLAAFAHGEYFELGKKIGNFGFSATKKKKNVKGNKR